ncbi:MAG TPA: lysophospholipid acyltransferase family protein [Acidobacteriota bacterium]|jgi:1-acyl-sn-glycerol-3-phosphate acyltransferase
MSAWQYDSARDLDVTPLERLRIFPREPDMLVYGARLISALLMRLWLRTYHRLSITGQGKLPKSESFVMVANHSSHLDALCLLAALQLRRVHHAFPAAAQDYFFVRSSRLIAAVVAVNALPFDRQARACESLNLCRQLLAAPGNVLIFFPEGTRSAAGEIAEFKSGVGLLLAGTRYPVVPCYLAGAYESWSRHRWFPRPGQIRLTIGEPRTYSDREGGIDSARHICAELRNEVLALAGDSQ